MGDRFDKPDGSYVLLRTMREVRCTWDLAPEVAVGVDWSTGRAADSWTAFQVVTLGGGTGDAFRIVDSVSLLTADDRQYAGRRQGRFVMDEETTRVLRAMAKNASFAFVR